MRNTSINKTQMEEMKRRELLEQAHILCYWLICIEGLSSTVPFCHDISPHYISRNMNIANSQLKFLKM